jgi:PilZ domain
MLEGRIAARHRVNKQARINYGGDKYPCTVRDISTTGAALEFPDLISNVRRAKAFILEIPEDRLKLSCRVVWQNGYRMGVTFD